MAVKRRIFISVPTRANLDDRQQAVFDALLRRLRRHHLAPEMFFEMGAAAGMSWSAPNVEEIMRRCVGAVVLAFPRWIFGSERGEMRFASEFAHYEAAAAIGKDLPLLLIVERGVMDRGITWTGAGYPILFIPETAGPDWLADDAFALRFNVWLDQVAERHDLFLGYCSKSKRTAQKIRRFLTDDVGLRVMDWETDFSAGASILEEIVRAARVCTGGIFLFTQDDFFESRRGKLRAAAPRDNVVFEAGYFAGARGRDRVLIVLEEGAKLPADLGGSIYLPLKNKSNITPILPAIRSFVATRL
jgi:hypothetical protein